MFSGTTSEWSKANEYLKQNTNTDSQPMGILWFLQELNILTHTSGGLGGIITTHIYINMY